MARSDAEIRVSRMQPGEEEFALESARLFRDSTWCEADARSFLADRRNYLVVATVGDEQAGYLVGYEMNRIDGPRPMMCLYELGVLERFRRRGVGQALVRHLLHYCADGGFAKMWVLTDTANSAARALYEHCGGEVQVSDPVLYWWRFDG